MLNKNYIYIYRESFFYGCMIKKMHVYSIIVIICCCCQNLPQLKLYLNGSMNFKGLLLAGFQPKLQLLVAVGDIDKLKFGSNKLKFSRLPSKFFFINILGQVESMVWDRHADTRVTNRRSFQFYLILANFQLKGFENCFKQVILA